MSATAADLPVLHLARVRGLLGTDAVGADGERLVEAGLLGRAGSGYALSPQGYERHAELLAAEREAVDLEALATAYERFLTVNQPAKDACAAWQRQAGDPEALFLTVDTLSGLLERSVPALERAGAAVPRFADYVTRLQGAIAAAGSGDARFLTDPAVDCFHGVWFECHEDFLVTLGRDREEEGSF